MAFTDTIARLAVSLNLDTAAFTTNSRKAKAEATGLQGHMSKVGKAIGAAFAGFALGEAVSSYVAAGRKALDAVGSLGEIATQLNVSTDALQEFRFAASQSGVDIGTMDKALGQFAKRMGEASLTGKGGFIDALMELGLTLDDLKGKTETQQIGLIADKLNLVESGAERAALQTQIFGKAGQSLAPLLEEGSKGLKAWAEEARKAGIIVEESVIKGADAAADKMSKIAQAREMNRNAVLAQDPEAILAYDQAMADLELGFYQTIAALEKWNQAWNTGALKFNANLRSTINEIIGFAALAPMHLRRMVGEIAAAITGRLSKVWEDAKAKVASVKAAFFDLWDKVTRRSYVPDMVDDIAREMARLDGVMVTPAKKAADATKQAMRDMAQETKSLLDRLFPEVGKALNYQRDLRLIDGSALSEADKAAARGRLGREVTGTAGDVPVTFLNDNDPLVDAREMREAAEATVAAFLGLRDKSKIATVAVAKNFQDMAQATLQSLNQLTGAIRGGGFLDILNAVVGLGLQLGGIGLFGKTIQGRINAPSTVPRYADGTNFHPGGLAIVGERRAELVELPRGSRVHPNLNALGSGRGNGGTLDIRPSPLFEVYMDGKLVQAAPMMMQGGAQIAQAQMAQRQRRRVA